jgi:dipeptidyl aminopeptidase/acylaminoacyl peptidase
MIVAIHGGPWTRDSAEFSGETQVWTSRGYAVLQVNFRGSTGLGRRHFEAGVGQLGLAMVDDIVDAVLWAVREKGVASDRVCVVGGSYGGYATLVALTRYPEMFACGVDYAGPVDLVTLVSSFPPDWKPFLPRSWYRFAGNPDVPAQRRAMEQQSPIHAVDRARAPLFIFQGANDPRVTRSQSDSIARAFCNKGLPVTYLVAGNEGHSFANEETALAVTRGVEVFVGRVLGGGVQKSVSPSVQRVLDQLSVKEPCAANGAR